MTPVGQLETLVLQLRTTAIPSSFDRTFGLANARSWPIAAVANPMTGVSLVGTSDNANTV